MRKQIRGRILLLLSAALTLLLTSLIGSPGLHGKLVRADSPDDGRDGSEGGSAGDDGGGGDDGDAGSAGSCDGCTSSDGGY